MIGNLFCERYNNMRNGFRSYLLIIGAFILFAVLAIYYRAFVSRDFVTIDTTAPEVEEIVSEE